MQLIKANNLYFKYPESIDFILENIKCEINRGDRIGITGLNGSGKSTLFKLLCNKIEPSEGSVFVDESCVIAYLPQEFIDSEDDIDEFLSGGEKVKLQLRHIMTSNPDVIFLDEPTNHLDVKGIEWLEKFIKRVNAAVVIISHDRTILNNCVNEIWEVEGSSLRIFKGKFDSYEKIKEDELNSNRKLFETKKEQIKKLEMAAIDRKNRAAKNESFKPSRSVKKNGSLCQYDVGSIRSVRSGNLMKSAKAVESRIEKERESLRDLKLKSAKKATVMINSGGTKSKYLVRMDKIDKSFDEKVILHGFSLAVERGEKIAVMGSNGSGKSTLLKIIAGFLEPDSGEVFVSPSAKTGYFAQGCADLPENETVVEFLAHGDKEKENRARLFLGCLNIKGDAVFKKISKLSAGQKSKIEIASLMLGEYDLIILDEPMSHLEINARTALEQALTSFAGAAIVVTHDRTFAQNFADRIVEI